MNIYTRLLLFLLLFATQLQAQQFEKATSFYPKAETLNEENIEWGYLEVPEDWNADNGKKIKLAVAVIKKSGNTETTSDPVVVIEGGPGAGAINSIWSWIYHPLREQSDIILMDLRGTGFSEPRLCPDLGNEFLKIFAKNQTAHQDELDKAKAVLTCQKKLLLEDVNVRAYNSTNIAKDLHSLQKSLTYEKWAVYGISYGTYMAQAYASYFPEDISSIILDSPIADISEYYTKNTINYEESLSKLFEACKNDENCNSNYPELERTYYETIEKLEKQPITVAVDKNIIEEKTFTYNAQDFKIAIHQALYNEQLIEVLPLLIYEFNKGNKDALSELVAAFSGTLSLDYGMYYCVTCSETIPNNSYEQYEQNNLTTKIKNGVSFYKSDFYVCDQWNARLEDSIQKTTYYAKDDIPALIFTGKYDPITPEINGEKLNSRIKESYLVNSKNSGHATSFTAETRKIVNQFVTSPLTQPNLTLFTSENNDTTFITDININKGVSKMGKNFGSPSLLFFACLLIAMLVCIVTFFGYLKQIIFKREKNILSLFLKLSLIICSGVAIVLVFGFSIALINTADTNFYTLAFGLPNTYDYLYTLLDIFVVILIISLLLFFISVRKIHNIGVVITILFSHIVIMLYFLYWGILSF